MRILVMGLPGSGKTYFSNALIYLINQKKDLSLEVEYFNADEIRKKFNDWDFSESGRLRQAYRMKDLSEKSEADYVICDFIAPTKEIRDIFNADMTIWIDTIDEGRFEDTNKLFEKPEIYDFHVVRKDNFDSVTDIFQKIWYNILPPKFDWKKPTVQMLGRFQPWHMGHRALFQRAITKTGQVVIMIRDCHGWNDSNPFNCKEVEYRIRRDLDDKYIGMYEIIIVPNIVNITYGRDVGYKIEQESFDEDVELISATKIRNEMGLK